MRRCFIPNSRISTIQPVKQQQESIKGNGLSDNVEHKLSKLTMLKPSPQIKAQHVDKFDKKVKRKNITMNF